MKEQILRIAKDLKQGRISENNAQTLLLGLFDVSNNEVAVCSRCGAKTVSHPSTLCYGCWMLIG
jgi:hypothetical protein